MAKHRPRIAKSFSEIAPDPRLSLVALQQDPKVAIREELITPELAAQYLAQARKNRRLIHSNLAELTAQFRTGKFVLSTDCIGFDVNDNLFNGQHRLTACVNTGIAFPAYVARGLPVATMDVVDTGKRRNASDVLSIHNHASSFGLASAARWLCIIKAGSFIRPSHADILALVNRNPTLIASVRAALHPLGIRPSVLAVIHYCGTQAGYAVRADQFVSVFVSGAAPLGSDDPAVKLRDKNVRDKLARRLQSDKASLIEPIYTWNHFCVGNTLQAFRFPADLPIIRDFKASTL